MPDIDTGGFHRPVSRSAGDDVDHGSTYRDDCVLTLAAAALGGISVDLTVLTNLTGENLDTIVSQAAALADKIVAQKRTFEASQT